MFVCVCVCVSGRMCDMQGIGENSAFQADPLR